MLDVVVPFDIDSLILFYQLDFSEVTDRMPATAGEFELYRNAVLNLANDIFILHVECFYSHFL